MAHYRTKGSTVCADFGCGSEMNCEYMVYEQITPFVEYHMFHAKMNHKRRNCTFLVDNMFITRSCFSLLLVIM